MSLKSNFSGICIEFPSTRCRNLAIPHGRTLRIRERREWRRRRYKYGQIRSTPVRCHFGPTPFESLFQNLLSQFPSVNSLDLIAPALGFASGVALYLSRFKLNRNSQVSDIGEWILFTSPTPFNRFVMLRCPSIPFEGSELLEDVNEKLVKEDRHFVRSNSGRIRVRDSGDGSTEEKLVYQRVCVRTKDGGVISLDWPANLELSEEHGLDTTLLLIPGTAQGSMDKDIRSFVCESLKRGCFPIVMNPRGCAGSPLTTSRLFTAADSDDISTAVQFITKERPWTTLTGVGWGYGANMLTKYLAEVREKTPLTAATCINNPFDLEEVTRSSPYHIAVNQQLTDGLIDILRSNKELFQGRAKGFDVEKALSAASIRDFEKEISMVSYGYDAIEDFYNKTSTRGVVGNVKIPVLFIQNDDGTVPLFSIPRGLIAENPFTSLLLCSCSPSSTIENDRSTISWCQHLTLEWLTAVELGLLKGRHPLLKDVDVNVNASKGLALMEGRSSNKSDRVEKLLNVPNSNALNGHSLHPLRVMLEGSDTAAGTHSSSRLTRDLQEYRESQDDDSDTSQHTNPADAEVVQEEGVNPTDDERGQVERTAELVMNMLDATVPGTLAEEQKKKVLIAMGQGETLMRALQDAVPEDVRGKLTGAVSEIMHNQGSNLKFDRLLSASQFRDFSTRLQSVNQEKTEGLSRAEGVNEDPLSSEQMKQVNDLVDVSSKNQSNTDKPSCRGLDSEPHASENLQKSIDAGQFQSSRNHGNDISGSEEEDTNKFGNKYENVDVSTEKVVQSSEHTDYGSETGSKGDFAGWSEKAHEDGGVTQSDIKDEKTTQQDEERVAASCSDQNMTTSKTKVVEELLPAASSSGAQLTEKEVTDNQKREEQNVQPLPQQNISNPTTFSVSQALDALTDIDDSTQVAVNSVFHVIEDMITQLEERENGTDIENSKKVEDQQAGSVPEEHHIIKKLENGWDKIDISLQPDKTDVQPSCNNLDSQNDFKAGRMEEKSSESPILRGGNGFENFQGNETEGFINEENEKLEHFVQSKNSAAKSYELGYLNSMLHHVPLYISAHTYEHPLYKESLRNYLISKMTNTQSLDLDTTTALFLDYIPEEGQWKLLEQTADAKNSIYNVASPANREASEQFSSEEECAEKIIEPSYVILDSEKQEESFGGYDKMNEANEKVEIVDNKSESIRLVRSIILDSLKVEVCRRLSAADMKEMDPHLAKDLEYVAHMVSLAVGDGMEHVLFLEGKDPYLEKVGTLQGEHIIRAISSSVQDTSYLRKVLPVGVIVGSSLAALRKFFNVASVNDDSHSEAVTPNQASGSEGRSHFQAGEKEANQVSSNEIDEKNGSVVSTSRNEKKAGSKSSNNAVMVGAVTAALGTSALLVHQQESYKGNKTSNSSFKTFKEKDNYPKELGKLEEEMPDKVQSNIITSLAEKAMSVAAPVVPTKEDGEVDQERLVAMLAELGQKGGILKLIGKIALLWGGIRGAMSLTDKLISFLRIAERPLFQRILGFVFMALVLWSPVVVPLLPTLVQNWAIHKSSKIAELTCIIGLYTSILILVVLWGRRIRGYENPLEQYGLDLTSLPKTQNFLNGLIGGAVVVLSVEYVNVLLGCVRFSWPSSLLSTSDAASQLRAYWQMLILVGRGLVTASGVALVEELLFRSWLPDEIAADLGYHRGIIISGLAFSLFQRSPLAIPGLWLLSLALAGARQRSGGSLSFPVGLRAGILASSFILQMGGFFTRQPNFPLWLTGTHPFQPFSGIVGLVFSVILAIVLYPRQPVLSIARNIRE